MQRILTTFAALALTIGGQAKAETPEPSRQAVAQMAANCSVHYKLTYAISEKVGRPEKFLKDLSEYFFAAAKKFDKTKVEFIVSTHASNMKILNGDDQEAIENLGPGIKNLQKPCLDLKVKLDKAFESYE
jgi:hypothetical protein